jgi:hypothetical protein
LNNKAENNKKKKKKRKKPTLKWEAFSERMTGEALYKYFNELIKLKGKEYTSEYRQGLQYVRPLLQRDVYIGDVPSVNFRELPREILLALRDAGSAAERNKIIKKWNRERNKTAD